MCYRDCKHELDNKVQCGGYSTLFPFNYTRLLKSGQARGQFTDNTWPLGVKELWQRMSFLMAELTDGRVYLWLSILMAELTYG